MNNSYFENAFNSSLWDYKPNESTVASLMVIYERALHKKATPDVMMTELRKCESQMQSELKELSRSWKGFFGGHKWRILRLREELGYMRHFAGLISDSQVFAECQQRVDLARAQFPGVLEVWANFGNALGKSSDFSGLKSTTASQLERIEKLLAALPPLVTSQYSLGVNLDRMEPAEVRTKEPCKFDKIMSYVLEEKIDPKTKKRGGGYVDAVKAVAHWLGVSYAGEMRGLQMSRTYLGAAIGLGIAHPDDYAVQYGDCAKFKRVDEAKATYSVSKSHDIYVKDAQDAFADYPSLDYAGKRTHFLYYAKLGANDFLVLSGRVTSSE